MRLSDDLVSFVMPIYKPQPEHLRTSLSTLLDQTYADLEVVLVIDLTGTHEDTSTLYTLESFKDDHRIRTIIRKKKLGYCSALNAGIRATNGEFVARLDSDDYCEPTRTEKQMELLLSSDVTLTGTWANVVDEHGVQIGQMRTPVSYNAIRTRIILHNPFVHSSIIFTKRAIREVGLYNEAFEGAEDYELYLRIISRGYQCKNIPQFLTYLRETRHSMTRGSGWRKTRKRYFQAKCEAVTRLKYRRAFDVLYAVASPISVLITPGIGLNVKKLVGWYTPRDSPN